MLVRFLLVACNRPKSYIFGCLEGVWKVSGRCLDGVWWVSGRCLVDNNAKSIDKKPQIIL